MRESKVKHAYEYIVVGCGGLGSAAAYRLAREARGEVLALEQFRLGHDNGASQDHSRIIRLSYHDPAYTALTPHTYTAWGEVEEESGFSSSSGLAASTWPHPAVKASATTRPR